MAKHWLRAQPEEEIADRLGAKRQILSTLAPRRQAPHETAQRPAEPVQALHNDAPSAGNVHDIAKVPNPVHWCMTAGIPTITTSRLILRPLELSDADAVQVLFPLRKDAGHRRGTLGTARPRSRFCSTHE
jgi:hypothetical protein